MKTIGLIGGLSWESSTVYYQLINQGVRERLGGLHSAKILLYSFDFEEITRLQRAAHWEEATQRMAEAARVLERGGADVLAICTNTMHKMAEEVQGAVRVPLVHIADVTREAVQAYGLRTVGLLGTRYTMEQEFMRRRLSQGDDLQVLVPDEPGRDSVHSVIFEELCRGTVCPRSRVVLVEVIESLASRGAEGVILGCTELMLLLKPGDSPLPLFDTTALHAEALVEHALASGPDGAALASLALSDHFAVAI